MKAVLSEPELISAMAVRDPAGAAALYDQYAATLFKIICCSVPNLNTAEAILEKTLHAVWHNCKDHQLEDKPLLLWMAGIARQFAHQQRKQD